MVTVALFLRLEAKAGKENAVAKFLETGLALANQEATTPIWFALRLGPATFGVFDAFTDESGRQGPRDESVRGRRSADSRVDDGGGSRHRCAECQCHDR